MESMQFGDYVINLRRELHMHPELSMEESWTSQRICQELTCLGIPYEIVGEKNVIGILHGSKSESTEAIALRADFDALPVTEEVNVPWKSKFDGVLQKKKRCNPVKAATLISAYSVVFGQVICPHVRLLQLPLPLRSQSVIPCR